MPAQVITGWARIYENILRWGRAVTSPGALTPEAIADACDRAHKELDAVVIKSGKPWAIKDAVIADVTGNLGTEIEFKTRRLLIETNLGITDLAMPYKLWRVDPANLTLSKPIFHVDQIGPENVERGAWISRWGDERWVMNGTLNASGDHEATIDLYNWGTALAGGSLKVSYWFTPADITSTVFFDTDASGNRTKRPQLPRTLWGAIEDYAKLVLLEATGDQYKQNSLWMRFRGPDGVLENARTLISTMQLGEPTQVTDVFTDEVGP